MKNEDVLKRAHTLASRFRITNGERFRLKDVDPADTLRFTSEDKPRAREALAFGIEALAELQDKLPELIGGLGGVLTEKFDHTETSTVTC